MKQLKKIELATCDVAEMNPQELQNANGGGFVELLIDSFDYAIRDVTGGRENIYTMVASACIPGYALYNGIRNIIDLW